MTGVSSACASAPGRRRGDALQRPVARDVGMDDRGSAGVFEPPRQLQRLHVDRLGPAFHRDPPVARVDADRDTAGEGPAGLAHQVGIAHRHGTQDHAADAAREPRLDRRHVPDAAAELNREIDRLEDRAHRVGVDRLAGEGAVEIDDVKPGEAGGGEGPRLRRGVVGEDRGPRHVALHEPDASAPLEVDRREEDHGAGSGGRSVRSVRSLQ